MQESSHEIEERLEALLHAFVIAVLAVGFLAGLAFARLADWRMHP